MDRFAIPAEHATEKKPHAVQELRNPARWSGGLQRTQVGDGAPRPSARKIHDRYVVQRNVAKQFVYAEIEAQILISCNTHRAVHYASLSSTFDPPRRALSFARLSKELVISIEYSH